MIDDLRDLVESTGAAGPVVFVVAYVALTVAMVPGSVPSLAAGALFGAVWGSVLVVVGATLGAVAAFEIARRLGRERVRRRFGERVARADDRIGEEGLVAVLGLRLLPVVPFNALNYALGLSAVTRRDNLIGTAVGIVPGSVAFVALGDSITEPTSAGFLVSVAAIVLLIVAGTWRRRRGRRPAPRDAGT